MVSTNLFLSLAPKLPVSWRMAARNGGHHVCNSLTHWCITVAGHTTSTGPKPSSLKARKKDVIMNRGSLHTSQLAIFYQ